MWDKLVHKWLKIPYALHVRTKQSAKKPTATVLFIHGIGTSGASWDDAIAKLPSNLNVIVIDLLGFGESPRPKWAVYSAKTQARSVVATLLKLRPNGRLIVVGHSLGALVAVEVARRYPVLVKSLILCSPPFYNDETTRSLLPNSDKILKRLYRLSHKHPEQFVKISTVAQKYGLINKAFNLSDDNISSYMSALEATIINQTSLPDAKSLKKPMTIIHGSFDPVVIRRNLKELARDNSRTTLRTILAGHEIQGRYVPAVIKAINEATAKPTDRRH